MQNDGTETGTEQEYPDQINLCQELKELLQRTAEKITDQTVLMGNVYFKEGMLICRGAINSSSTYECFKIIIFDEKPTIFHLSAFNGKSELYSVEYSDDVHWGLLHEIASCGGDWKATRTLIRAKEFLTKQYTDTDIAHQKIY